MEWILKTRATLSEVYIFLYVLFSDEDFLNKFGFFGTVCNADSPRPYSTFRDPVYV